MPTFSEMGHRNKLNMSGLFSKEAHSSDVSVKDPSPFVTPFKKGTDLKDMWAEDCRVPDGTVD